MHTQIKHASDVTMHVIKHSHSHQLASWLFCRQDHGFDPSSKFNLVMCARYFDVNWHFSWDSCWVKLPSMARCHTIVRWMFGSHLKSTRACCHAGLHYTYDTEKHCSKAQDSTRYVIDATYIGNIARFVNHSCSPNLVARDVCAGECLPAMAHSSQGA